MLRHDADRALDNWRWVVVRLRRLFRLRRIWHALGELLWTFARLQVPPRVGQLDQAQELDDCRRRCAELEARLRRYSVDEETGLPAHDQSRIGDEGTFRIISRNLEHRYYEVAVTMPGAPVRRCIWWFDRPVDPISNRPR